VENAKALRLDVGTGRAEYALGWLAKPSHNGCVIARFVDGLSESTVLFEFLKQCSKVATNFGQTVY
jgi:hypothetical protein